MGSFVLFILGGREEGESILGIAQGLIQAQCSGIIFDGAQATIYGSGAQIWVGCVQGKHLRCWTSYLAPLTTLRDIIQTSELTSFKEEEGTVGKEKPAS